ncbi:hypothetical protein K1T71_001992 [Dendrolimus kikuchii]|uniref:Uncharacterized protein n=1 Tax=Dendrolimus kikuchii TaxID=765133 RepID=A0ACC1DG13_9NEOP|nr:hypothetical protein K1T71_001992 [Dendrolimus kikuchii]
MSERAQLSEPIPLLAIAVYIACVAGSSILANFSVVAAILKSTRNGLFCIILQLAIADIFLGIAVSLELWSSNARTWFFSDSGCVIYRGLHVFATTASSYFVATTALHTLATINLEEKALLRRTKRRNQDEDEEIKSSRHSLVTSSDSSTPPRTMNVDYRLTETRVSVNQPIIFVWILSMSLSIPEFVLANALHLDHGIILCTIVDSGKRLHMYSILALINLLLPSTIMLVAGFLVFLKTRSKKIISRIENSNIIGSLKLSLWLIIIYIILCAPRSFLSAYDIYSTSLKRDDLSFIKTTHQNDYFILMKVSLSCAYLVSVLLRPLLCIFLLPRVRKIFSYNASRVDEPNEV